MERMGASKDIEGKEGKVLRRRAWSLCETVRTPVHPPVQQPQRPESTLGKPEAGKEDSHHHIHSFTVRRFRDPGPTSAQKY